MTRRRLEAPWAPRTSMVHVVLAGLLLASGLLGCSIGPMPATRFYRLVAAPPGAAPASKPRLQGILVVERFATDDLIAERPIVYSNGTGAELHQHRYHHWVEPPTDMLQQQLVSYLQARGAASMVTTPDARVRPDFVLRGRLSRFERILDDDQASGVRVCIETRMSLTRTADRRLLWSDTYRVELPASDAAVATSVAAFDRGLGELLAYVDAGIPAR